MIRRPPSRKEVDKAMDQMRQLWQFPKIDREAILRMFREGESIEVVARAWHTSPSVIEQVIRAAL